MKEFPECSSSQREPLSRDNHRIDRFAQSTKISDWIAVLCCTYVKMRPSCLRKSLATQNNLSWKHILHDHAKELDSTRKERLLGITTVVHLLTLAGLLSIVEILGSKLFPGSQLFVSEMRALGPERDDKATLFR